MYIYDNTSLNFSYNEKYFTQKLYRKSEHTFRVQKLVYKNRAFCEVMLNTVEEQDRPQVTTEHAACVSKF
jgi:hypothetical protein